jgi:hypothetical protein
VSDIPGNVPKEFEERFLAGVEMVQRTGSKQFQLRWSDDETPVIWMAVSIHDDDQTLWEVAAGHNPLVAVSRLLEQLVDGAQCKHCGRPAGLDPDSLDTMPLNELVCWYQYDPELKKFRRGCEGDA